MTGRTAIAPAVGTGEQPLAVGAIAPIPERVSLATQVGWPVAGRGVEVPDVRAGGAGERIDAFAGRVLDHAQRTAERICERARASARRCWHEPPD